MTLFPSGLPAPATGLRVEVTVQHGRYRARAELLGRTGGGARVDVVLAHGAYVSLDLETAVAEATKEAALKLPKAR